MTFYNLGDKTFETDFNLLLTLFSCYTTCLTGLLNIKNLDIQEFVTPNWPRTPTDSCLRSQFNSQKASNAPRHCAGKAGDFPPSSTCLSLTVLPGDSKKYSCLTNDETMAVYCCHESPGASQNERQHNIVDECSISSGNVVQSQSNCRKQQQSRDSISGKFFSNRKT